MDDLTRRAVLAGTTGVGVSILFGPAHPAQGAEPKEVTELFVIGPYNLGDWLEKNDLKFGNFGVELGAAARKAMIKSFRECWVYFIDQRVRPENGPIQFAKDGPRVAFSGSLHHEWKDGEKQLVVEISGANLSNQKTVNKKPVPTRTVDVTVRLRTAEQDGKTSTSTTTVFTTDALPYDIKGSKG